MNALEIIQQAAMTLGVGKVISIADREDLTTQRLLGCLNRALEDICKEKLWKETTNSFYFSTDPNTERNRTYQIDGAIAGYNIKAMLPDFDCLVTEYVYDFTANKRINSISLDAYLRRNLSPNNSSVPSSFLMYKYFMCFDPEIPYDHTISFFYKSKYFVVDAVSRAGKEYFANDTDWTVMDSQLLLRGTMWRFKYEMGFDYSESYRDYQRFLERVKDQNSNKRNIGGSPWMKRGLMPFIRNFDGEVI